jgi:hypothetical protein
LTLVSRYEKVQVSSAAWDGATKLEMTGKNLIQCSVHCNNQDIQGELCTSYTFDPVLGSCSLASLELQEGDYLVAGGRGVYVRLNPDGSLPMQGTYILQGITI